ncbi:mucin-17-like isoform X2 [Aphis gossypii]|uniref:mucin-17-like isoform X2 n=1 Tax=Aphis gossypii TaxID=80765 RepID=UPI0021592809|nr:mucin-17-like isoform X2 [Aphis gossypii]
MDPTSSNDIESDLYDPDVSPVLSTVETSTFDIETPSTGKKNVEVAVPVVYPGEEPTLKPVHSTELMTGAISFVETDTNAPVDTSTFDIVTPSTGKKNVEVAVPVVYPGEEPTLKPAHSTELMTEAISFVETDTNAPVDTPTCEIEIPGPETDDIEMARPVVCPAEVETLSPAHSTELMTSVVIRFVEADTNAPVETSTCVIETLGPCNMENVEVAAPPAVVSLTEVQTLSQTSIIDTDKTTAPSQKKKNRFLSALRRGLRRVFKTICGCGCSVASSDHPGGEDYRDEFTHEIETFNERWSV